MTKKARHVLRGHYTPQGLTEVLGMPPWEWALVDSPGPTPCGLAEGPVQTAGWGDSSGCCRIWVHSDGICIGPGLDVADDRAKALEIYLYLLRLQEGVPA